jgi:hypothetical protein
MSEQTKWSMIILALAAAVFALVASLSEPERGLLAGYSTGVILTAVYIKWRMRESWYFWAVIGLATALHAILVAALDLPRLDHPGVYAVPLCIIDVAVIFALLEFLDRNIRDSSGPGRR